MPRCDYDVVFYRVFCITLLGVAFSFTVILTNVFIDIDGLLYNKNKEKQSNLETIKSDYEVISTNYSPQDTIYDDYEAYDTERTKRSLEPEDIIQQIKDTHLKNILKQRLFSYIQQLSEETDTTTDKKDTHSEEKDKSNTKDTHSEEKDKTYTKDNKNTKHKEDFVKVTINNEEKDILKVKDSINKDSEEIGTNIDVIKDIQRLKIKKDLKKNDEMLHLAIHNVILQGIIGHMNLKDVYKKAQEMAANLEDSSEKGNHNLIKDSKFVNELIECKDLHEDIAKEKTKKTSKELNQNDKKKTQNITIRTLINITSLVNEKVNQDMYKTHYDILNSNETLNGIIKLIFNGKEINFKKIEEKTTKKPTTNQKTNTYVPNVFIKNILNEYLNKYKDSEDNHNKRHKRNNVWKYDIIDYLKQIQESGKKNNKNEEQNNRHKRNNNILDEYFKQIKDNGKINNHKLYKRNSEMTTVKPKVKDDDELFVEIETHFDSKGMKGDRKKKLIRDLVDKIQKAIHSDSPIKKKHKNLHIKKRMQNPLDRIEKVLPKFNLKNLGHRALDPITKIISLHERIPLISNHEGDSWRYSDTGPKFLTPSKSINSAEKNEYEAEFRQDLESEIPQRLQVPLMADDTANFYDLGNVKFLMKNIDDSGFSIGYNQYTDQAPDQDTMKLFTGLENVIQTYHQKFDVEENVKEEKTEHEIVRRAIKDSDYHSNEYKVIFNNNFLPFDNYQQIYNQKIVKKKNHKKNNNEAFILDESIFNKELKPSEIFSLANFFNRKKRSMNVKKITNLNKKKKVSRYLNTKAMRKRFYVHNKRNKRQIDKIRIIARDLTPKRSEEEIFVVSNEKLIADRALVKEMNMNMPEVSNIDDKEVEHEHYDVITPQKGNEQHFDIISPFIYEPPKENAYSDIFSKISRHNALMSKYPHIFMEEINKDDEYDGYNPVIVHNHKEMEDNSKTYTTTVATVDTNYYNQMNMAKPVYGDYKYYDKSNDKKNYKVTVKITPKNSSLHSGFKEVHTSINKSYNKNGLIYTSLVNVSELSKVEKANKAREFQHENLHRLKHEHDQIKEFIEQHKNRLEEQLTLLKNERQKLEDIDQDIDGNTVQFNFNNNAQSTDMTGTPKTIEDKKIIEQKHESTTTTTTAATTETTTYKTTTPNVEKLIMYKSIQKNENITNQILSKININNELLKTFLEKLASKLITTTPKAPETTEMKLPEPYEQMKKMFFGNNPRELNKDPMSVPFIYMYQHPVNISRQPANILYHGHIHSDAYNQIHNYNQEKEIRRKTEKDKIDSNLAKPPNFIEGPNFAKPLNYEPPNFAKPPNFIEGPNFAKPAPYDEAHNFLKPVNVVKDAKYVKIPNHLAKNDTKFFLDEVNDFKILAIDDKKYYNTTKAE